MKDIPTEHVQIVVTGSLTIQNVDVSYFYQGWRGHWAVYYTSLQSLKLKFYYSLA